MTIEEKQAGTVWSGAIRTGLTVTHLCYFDYTYFGNGVSSILILVDQASCVMPEPIPALLVIWQERRNQVPKRGSVVVEPEMG